VIGLCVLAICAAVSACDPIYEITLRNNTDHAVTARVFPRRSETILQPGESRGVVVPIDRSWRTKVLVDAVGADGQIVFCQEYTVEELNNLAGRVSVVGGALACH